MRWSFLLVVRRLIFELVYSTLNNLWFFRRGAIYRIRQLTLDGRVALHRPLGLVNHAPTGSVIIQKTITNQSPLDWVKSRGDWFC
jgi:hypothetical protein